MYEYIYIYTYIYVCVYIYTYIYINTHCRGKSSKFQTAQHKLQTWAHAAQAAGNSVLKAWGCDLH